MRRTRFPSVLTYFYQPLTILALAVVLMSPVWAQPEFKILATVPGGLWSGVSFDAKGNLYGTTTGGGTHNDGTIFELSPGAHGWSLNIIHSFDGYDGGGGNGGLIFDAKGNMYGTSPAGGAHDGGNVFEMAPGSGGWTFDDLYDFCPVYHCPDGSAPTPVILDSVGRIYGAVAGGGAHGRGGVFRLTRRSRDWQESIIGSFGSRPYDSHIPYAAPVFDANGSLYGTTYYGGLGQVGTVYELRRSGSFWKERRLRQFNGKNGAYASSPLMLDDSGSFYGTTVGGGAWGNGVVFKMARRKDGNWKESLVYQFPEVANGKLPSSGLVSDTAGNLYGTTGTGGTGGCFGGCGVVYKLTATGNGKWIYTVLHRFHGADGFQPGGGLGLDQEGNIYGTAYSVVFEITP